MGTISYCDECEKPNLKLIKISINAEKVEILLKDFSYDLCEGCLRHHINMITVKARAQGQGYWDKGRFMKGENEKA